MTGSSARLVTTNFNPRPPRGGRLDGKEYTGCDCDHFNPRPPRGGRPGAVLRILQIQQISIHAPREGGDEDPADEPAAGTVISIHAPREGGDFLDLMVAGGGVISIHAPREGGD